MITEDISDECDIEAILNNFECEHPTRRVLFYVVSKDMKIISIYFE